MRVILMLGVCGWALAQQAGDLFQKAPPDVDQALRAKVNEFFTLHVDGKFRKAEALVCEDSKDLYYTARKEVLRNFDIIKIAYEDEFKKAKVTMKVAGEMRTAHGTMPTIVPMTTMWRIEGGGWCNYIPPIPKEGVETPFGGMRPGETNQQGVPLPPVPTGTDFDPQKMGAQIMNSIKVSRTLLKLNSEKATSDEVEIENGSTTELTVTLPQLLPRKGLKVSLSQDTIRPGQKATLRVEFDPPDSSPKAPYDFVLAFAPLPKAFPMRVTFEYPEAIKKQLPAEVLKRQQELQEKK